MAAPRDERLQNVAITDPVALADFVEQEHMA
jgi:phosphoribosylamine--glycine ligase